MGLGIGLGRAVIIAAGVTACMASAGAGLAQEAGNSPAVKGLTVELNGLNPSDKGCKLTFTAESGLKQDIDKLSFEFVLFNGQGLVERMAVLDFRDLPAGKTKVRQFDLAGTRCEALGSLLINDAPVCQGADLAREACMGGLRTGSKAPIALKG
ncbi:hypothetical protein [Rhizobium rhizosphaerae]